MNSVRPRREPLVNLGIQRARVVRKNVGYESPTELPIEVLAHIRGALVRPSPTTGARANVIRIQDRGVVSVAGGLPHEQRRWAIAHELGHFELHPGETYVGLCTGEDMLLDYLGSGHEQEANAFAAELLMPEDLYAGRCDVARVFWGPIKALAEDFQVSATAAALRFLTYTYDRVAIVSCRAGKVEWSRSTRDFGKRLARGTKLDPWSLAHDFFAKGACSPVPETVSASAWVPGARDDAEVVEHVLPMPRLNTTLSLLWFPAK
jgi:Zn-dependent peptidase ImmA (M78 family)